MGNGSSGGGWRYTARRGWNWRSARTVTGALASLALPMPPWFRAVVTRGLLTPVALQAGPDGIWGSAGPAPCPWPDVAVVVVWDYHRLRIVGIARHGDALGGGPAARALASRAPAQSRPPRRRALLRHPSYAAFIAPDGSPYDAGYVLTSNGWCVDVGRLQATVRHFAPHARFADLSGVSEPESDGPFGLVLETLAGLAELIGWRRFCWLAGVAAAVAVLAASAARLGTGAAAPIGVAVGALALIGLGYRAVAVRRRRRRSAHPEAWLGSGREDAERRPLAGRLALLGRGRLAAWTARGRRSTRR